jgi:hypothetical protein
VVILLTHVSTTAAALRCVALSVAWPQYLDILKKKPDLLQSFLDITFTVIILL